MRLIGADGGNFGVVDRETALRKADEAGLDLVEISPNADPPVCKILDIGKYKYEEQKRKNEARKKQKVIEVKEIKLRPNIDDHDYEVKMRSMKRFLEEGDKVKVTLRFRGREMAHMELRAPAPQPREGRFRTACESGTGAAARRSSDRHGICTALTRCESSVRWE